SGRIFYRAQVFPSRRRIPLTEAVMSDDGKIGTSGADNAAWKAIVARYQRPSTWKALWQIVDTIVPYAGLWYLMYLCLAISWWLVVPLAVLAGAFLVRVFIIFHDCGHGSFFKSP